MGGGGVIAMHIHARARTHVRTHIHLHTHTHTHVLRRESERSTTSDVYSINSTQVVRMFQMLFVGMDEESTLRSVTVAPPRSELFKGDFYFISPDVSGKYSILFDVPTTQQRVKETMYIQFPFRKFSLLPEKYQVSFTHIDWV